MRGLICPILIDDIHVYKLFLWKMKCFFSEINSLNLQNEMFEFI